jgi:DNA-binding transcriptional ArsR family regulator
MADAMKLLDACRSPIRRKIMILAEELEQRDEVLTAKGATELLGYGYAIGSVSYHVKQLAEVGALKNVGGEQRRGAWQKYYVPSDGFKATMTDTVALDLITELLETLEGQRITEKRTHAAVLKLAGIIRATGRPVEA